MNPNDRIKLLTNREREVLALFAEGIEYIDIGAKLFIAENTVKSHVSHIYDKLGLSDLPKKARVIAIREKYAPLLNKVPQPINETSSEIEIILPPTPNVEIMLEEDVKAIRDLVALKQPSKKQVKRPRRRWIACCTGIILLFITAAGIGVTAGLGLWNFEDLGAGISQEISSVVPEQIRDLFNITSLFEPTEGENAQSTVLATDQMALQIQSGATIEESSLVDQSTATSTVPPTNTPLPTLTNTPRPSPTYNFGPIYELGEWHKEGNFWIRLFSHRIEYDGIYITVEVWNKTNQTKFFHWETFQNTFMRDNLGNQYELSSKFDQKEDDEIVPAQTRMFVGADPYTELTTWFKPDNLFVTGVTDLYFTLEYFADLERATWRISIGD